MRNVPLLLIQFLAVALLAARTTCIGADSVRKGDVIAFVGGEDMVTVSEAGELEWLLIRGYPTGQLRFRNLAWEGDTVFEQPRDLNFPPLDAQLDKVGATLVIGQFGEMESFRGDAGVEAFREQLEALVARLSAGGKRRVLLVAPALPKRDSASSNASTRAQNIQVYSSIAQQVAERSGCLFCSLAEVRSGEEGSAGGSNRNEFGIARAIAGTLNVPAAASREPLPHDALLDLIRAKNRLWFHYWRPQNWAFLNGDRTAQPSSRDHLDPSKRWFPAEIEQFGPLIEAKEREIDALAAKLTK